MSDLPPIDIGHWLAGFDLTDPLRLHQVIKDASEIVEDGRIKYPKLTKVLAFAKSSAGYRADDAGPDFILSPDHVLAACRFFRMVTIQDVEGTLFDVSAINTDALGGVCQPMAALSFDTQALPTEGPDALDSTFRRDLYVPAWCEFIPSDDSYAVITQAHLDEILAKAPRFPGPYYANGRDCDNSAWSLVGWLSQCRPDAGNLPFAVITARLYNDATPPWVTSHRLAAAKVDGTARLIDCFDLREVAQDEVMGMPHCLIERIWA